MYVVAHKRRNDQHDFLFSSGMILWLHVFPLACLPSPCHKAPIYRAQIQRHSLTSSSFLFPSALWERAV